MTARKHGVADALLSSLLVSHEKPEDLIGGSGLLRQMSKFLAGKVLNPEMAIHSGCDKDYLVSNPAGNTRNRRSKTILKGGWPIETPRGLQDRLQLQLIGKHQAL